MKKNTLIVLLTLMTISFVACKKDDDDDDEITPTTTPTVENVLCDGKIGVTSYFPLAQGNKYSYERNYYASGNPVDSFVISGTGVYGGVMYMKARNYDGLTHSTHNEYYRVDSIGNVYYYSTDNNQEYLIIPAHPTVNQMLGPNPTHYGTTAKITSLSASLNTSSCNYTNLMSINYYGTSGGLITTVYYKKGLGFVKDGDFHVTSAFVY